MKLNTLKNFNIALCKLGFTKIHIIDNLPDYLDGVSSKDLRKMTVKEIYTKYKKECIEWIDDNAIGR